MISSKIPFTIHSTETYTLPAFWAPYLINGDAGGLSAADLAAIDHWLTSRPQLGACLSCSDDPIFTEWHSALAIRAVDCFDYVFPVKGGAL